MKETSWRKKCEGWFVRKDGLGRSKWSVCVNQMAAGLM